VSPIQVRQTLQAVCFIIGDFPDNAMPITTAGGVPAVDAT